MSDTELLRGLSQAPGKVRLGFTAFRDRNARSVVLRAPRLTARSGCPADEPCGFSADSSNLRRYVSNNPTNEFVLLALPAAAAPSLDLQPCGVL
jgi:hypothetical protein